mmetsp:Transcript_23666/g.48065  ORF Transcript_23666/g.48065 Transcript_23666/m.48065 type:complete len:241 (+) Transcript_23666:17-739(+)|eukprot:CAMPEP_0119089682 /NCGR_PEP_ID=MMETSP1178-20130426/149771_1 /TAXON_ID=33656 /ORGANISM="unid sp, Strain CCMP2000" /LENGTH=240 /DNA_ID=CAMNT_0007073051 /DNA_START=14 /DNA_END=736 /DNA_ORIENTATION=-
MDGGMRRVSEAPSLTPSCRALASLIVPLAALAAAWCSLETVDACDAAQHRLSLLAGTWAIDPLSVAEALRPAWDSAASAVTSAPSLELLDPAAAECCRTCAVRCVDLRRHAEPLLEFLKALRETVAAPRRRVLAQAAGRAPPRVLVVGAGPAGLPAALVAHAEGANVTVVEKRQGFGRQVWFDLEPFDGGAQQVLREWGFFALRPAHVPDENGSGVVTVQCATLESFLVSMWHASRREHQ